MDETNQAVNAAELVNQAITSFGFDRALNYLKEGNRVYRAGWCRQGAWLGLQKPDENSKMTLPYIYMVSPKRMIAASQLTDEDYDRCPWLASQVDLLAEDWYVYPL